MYQAPSSATKIINNTTAQYLINRMTNSSSSDPNFFKIKVVHFEPSIDDEKKEIESYIDMTKDLVNLDPTPSDSLMSLSLNENSIRVGEVINTNSETNSPA